MSREDRNRIGYTVALVSEFAARHSIRPRQAYNYLKNFKGLKYLEECYGFLHTQSFQDGVETMTRVCSNNGGELR